jgi:hypothetical protein
LVGEIRSYTEDWDRVENVYANQPLDASGSNILPVKVWALPLEMDSDGQKYWLEFPSDFSFDSFQADLLKELQESYHLKRIAQTSGGAENNLYLVYATTDP